MKVLFTDGREMSLFEGLVTIRHEYPEAVAYDAHAWEIDLDDLRDVESSLGLDRILVWASEAASLDDPGQHSIAKITTKH